MIDYEILQDIITDHKLCKTQENELEKVVELLKADRLIELPCKVGDTVWIVRENIHEATICRIVLNISESNNFINLDVAYEYVDWFYNDGRKEKIWLTK